MLQVSCLTFVHSRCRRISRCIIDGSNDGCVEEPAVISFNYLTIASNLKIPPQTGRLSLFSLSGTPEDEIAYKYYLKFLGSTAEKTNVELADERFFQLIGQDAGCNIYIVRSIEGPQNILLEITVKITNGGNTVSTMVSRVYIHVSEFEY